MIETFCGAKVELIRSARKTLSLQIGDAEHLIIRAPLRMPEYRIRMFLEEKRNWVVGKLEARKQEGTTRKLTPEELELLIRQAKEVLPGLTAAYAERIGVIYGRITIRHQRSKWGSCSAKGNLNFNCLLMLVPAEVREYVLVHELCHRLEMNHSARFWGHVARILPDYRERAAWLRRHGNALIRSLPE